VFQERNGDSVGRNFHPSDVHEVPNVGDIELVIDFLETVQLIAGLHLEGTELISQLQLDIAGRVDDVSLDP
jgi:hypothetical protein